MCYDSEPIGSEARTEMMIETALKYQRAKRDAQEGIWTTGDGRKIAVEDMSETHIRNTIAYIKRVDEIDMYVQWLVVFENELKRRRQRGESDDKGNGIRCMAADADGN